jgi:hypothetical protein
VTALVRDARALVDFIGSLPDFAMRERGQVVYEHMGAMLADAILQAGLNYRSVVWPRVQTILSRYPDAKTVPGFCMILDDVGAARVLQWSHPEKPSRLRALTHALAGYGIATHDELARWLRAPGSGDALRAIRGIGPKTVDYLANLAGVDTIAVDRHVSAFVAMAHVERRDYAGIRSVVAFAADLLGVERRTLDYSIWMYQSGSAWA